MVVLNTGLWLCYILEGLCTLITVSSSTDMVLAGWHTMDPGIG